ncbi:low specificity L-threonine aldolase [Vineibacter terrae]|uniref:threonine aldolase family protein n=1 Tax=Vineibacter terrae TaxID=2586908 RepID=UPI002E340022|nr:low specificity L-threonine aldolase [Vineibacter terrae]HEX2889999.1 low specificity L-threonine aldolase [Vineibacter terrae]
MDAVLDFRSDNTAGAHPAIIEALGRAYRAGPMASYGEDPLTERVVRRLRAIFEHDSLVAYPVATGTAANALALSCLTPPWGVVYCHPAAHIQVDEAGAPELFSGGAKLVPVDGPAGKIDALALATVLAQDVKGVVHHPQPAAVSITQATECGASYTPDEVGTLAALAREHGLAVHMDGARLANAVVHLGCTPAAVTWQAGVDVLSFGATKNGALGAEAVVFFDPARAREFEFRRKRGGHLFSKMRLLSAQLDAYLDDGLWLANARHANAMAESLETGLSRLNSVRLLYPRQANELFVALPDAIAERLRAAGALFYPWPSDRPGEKAYRLVTSFETRPEQVARAVAAAAG